MTLKFGSFRQRQFLILLTLSMLPLLIIAGIGLPYSRQFVLQQATSQLETVADLQTLQVQRWLAQGHEAAHLLSREQHIKRSLLLLLTTQNSDVHVQARRDLQNKMNTIVEIFPYVHAMSLLDPTNGQVILSTDPTQHDRVRKHESYFRYGKQELYTGSILYSVGRETPVLTISMPVHDLANENLLAVAAVEMDLANLNSVFDIPVGIGETGHVYLIEAGYGFYVTIPSSIEGKPFRSIARSKAVEQILAGHSGRATYRAPRGVLVLGIFRHLPAINAGILVEIEEAELTRWIRQIWLTILVSTGIMLILAIVLAKYLTDRLVRPLEHITIAARALHAGDLSQRVPIEGPDEIGVLAGTFNKMAGRLQTYYAELEDRVTQRTAELANAMQKAEKARKEALEAQRIAEAAHTAAETARKASEAANQAKSIFLANMSHELRTPLNVILGFTQILQQDHQLNAQSRENIATIHRSGEHLLSLINQILDLSKIEAGQSTLNTRDFDLHLLLDEVEHFFTLKASNKGLSLAFERTTNVPRFVHTDDVKLRQILMNLLGNAIKFTEKGRITVKIDKCHLNSNASREVVHSRQSSMTSLHFSISDSGPGIKADEIEHIFEAFRQAKSGQHYSEGTGLGLAISQKFIQLMRGDIAVNSVIGQGTTFTFTVECELPTAPNLPESERLDQKILTLEPGQPRYRLLVVDDKSDNRRLLCNLLQSLGFAVQEAASGEEALTIWEQWHPHVIWMDILMPGMDGYEITKRIRALDAEHFEFKNPALATRSPEPNAEFPVPSSPRPIIIAVTAAGFEEERQVALSKGCDDFLHKPFKASDVVQLLHTHLRVRFISKELLPSSVQIYNLVATVPGDIITTDRLHSLPDDLLERLRSAVNTIDLNSTNTILEQIRSHDQALAKALTVLVDRFRFDVLQEYLGDT